METLFKSLVEKTYMVIRRFSPLSTMIRTIQEIVIPHAIGLAEWIPPCASGHECAYRSDCGSTGCTFCRDGQYHTGKYTKYYYGFLTGGYCVVTGYCNQCWTDLDYCTVPTGTPC